MGFITTYKVRFGDTDPAGVMYFPRFLDVFHGVFEDWFDDELDVPYRWSIEDRRIGFPAVHTECDYRAPFRFGDLMDVELTLVRLGERSFTCRYDARVQGEDRVRVQARVVSVVCNMDTFESHPMPARLRKALELRLEVPVRQVRASAAE
jgi:4-hydroxybenzoyl-CoA thioesterase